MTSNVVKLDVYRNPRPKPVGPAEVLMNREDLVVRIPDGEIMSGYLPWADYPIEAYKLGFRIVDEVVPFYYIGIKSNLLDQQGTLIVCRTQLYEERFIDGSREVSILVRPKKDKQIKGVPKLWFRCGRSQPNKRSVIEKHELPYHYHGELVVIKSYDK